MGIGRARDAAGRALRRRARDRPHARRALAARDGRREGAGGDDRRHPARGGPPARGGGVLPLSRLRGRGGGRLRLHREARASLDRSMKAILLRETGGPDKLQVEEVDEPEEPSLRVRAVGLNFMDVLVRRGHYPQMPELPHVLGSEVAGELDGRRVLGFPLGSGGGYAERVAVDPQWTFPLPEGAGFEEGAAFLMAYLTAWMPLRRLEGGTVLVTA